MNNLFYYTTSIRVAPGAKYEIPQTRSIPAAITHARVCILGCGARDYICARLAGHPRPPRSPSRGGDLKLGGRFNVSL